MLLFGFQFSFLNKFNAAIFETEDGNECLEAEFWKKKFRLTFLLQLTSSGATCIRENMLTLSTDINGNEYKQS